MFVTTGLAPQSKAEQAHSAAQCLFLPLKLFFLTVYTPTLSQKSSQPGPSMETLKTINPLNKGTGTAVEALDSTMAKMGMGTEGQKRATSKYTRGG